MATAAMRNNLIAGFFLILSIVAAVAVSAVISGVGDRLRPTREYIVRFSILDGAPGLSSGSPVALGGQAVGRVASVHVRLESAEAQHIDAKIRVRSDLALSPNAGIYLVKPLLGSESWLNIADTGGPAETARGPVVLVGRIAPPEFLTQAGYGPVQMEQIRKAIAQMTDLVDRLDRLTIEIEPKVGDVATDMAAASKDIREVATLLRERAPIIADQTEQVLASASEISTQLSGLLGDVQGGVEEARAMIERARLAVDDARPVVDRILANVESAASKVDQESITKLNEALDQGKTAATSLASSLEEVTTLLQEHGPSLGKTMANARLASDQLRLAAVEIRQSPWRLLYRPSTKELEAELIYSAAQSYAQAVSDLRAATEAMDRLSASPSRGGAASEAVAHRVREALVRYEAAESEFLRLLGGSRR